MAAGANEEVQSVIILNDDYVLSSKTHGYPHFTICCVQASHRVVPDEKQPLLPT